MRQTNKKLLTAFLMLLAIGIPWTNASAGPDAQTGWQTLSGRGVILEGGSFVDVSLNVPACPRNKDPLVLGLHVSPEVIGGASSLDVVNLPKWAASVYLYQRYTGASISVPLTVLGQGPEHISANLPAGQSIDSSPLVVRINLLGGTPASHRFDFNVHVTGACGTASIMP